MKIAPTVADAALQASSQQQVVAARSPRHNGIRRNAALVSSELCITGCPQLMLLLCTVIYIPRLCLSTTWEMKRPVAVKVQFHAAANVRSE